MLNNKKSICLNRWICLNTLLLSARKKNRRWKQSMKSIVIHRSIVKIKPQPTAEPTNRCILTFLCQSPPFMRWLISDHCLDPLQLTSQLIDAYSLPSTWSRGQSRAFISLNYKGLSFQEHRPPYMANMQVIYNFPLVDIDRLISFWSNVLTSKEEITTTGEKINRQQDGEKKRTFRTSGLWNLWIPK